MISINIMHYKDIPLPYLTQVHLKQPIEYGYVLLIGFHLDLNQKTAGSKIFYVL